jgi:hypothetical protein
MRKYPFLDKELSHQELKRDLLYNKIPVYDRQNIVNAAWAFGIKAANEVYEKYGLQNDIIQIAIQSGLKIKRELEERVSGNLRYFGEFVSKENLIVLYSNSIKNGQIIMVSVM